MFKNLIFLRWNFDRTFKTNEYDLKLQAFIKSQRFKKSKEAIKVLAEESVFLNQQVSQVHLSQLRQLRPNHMAQGFDNFPALSSIDCFEISRDEIFLRQGF